MNHFRQLKPIFACVVGSVVVVCSDPCDFPDDEDSLRAAVVCESENREASINSFGRCDPCTENAECGPEEFCQIEIGQCGGEGHCQPRPDDCSFTIDPVCGCDGDIYTNACEASLEGANIRVLGACDAD